MADRDIPEEMVEKAARELFGGPHYRTKVVGGDIVEYTVTWDEAEEPGPYGRAVHRGQARRVLSAALAGRQVVDLPVLDADSDAIDGGADYTIGALVRSADGTPRVHFDAADDTEQACLSWSADLAERVGLALVAVARRAKQMAAEGVAAGSGSGEGAAPGPVHPDGATEGHFQPSPGRVSGMTDPIDELAVRVLNEHLLAGPRPGQCRCGWGDGSDVRTLGRSHSKHVVEQLRAVGALTGSGSGEADVQPEPQHLTDPQRLTVRPTWEDPS